MCTFAQSFQLLNMGNTNQLHGNGEDGVRWCSVDPLYSSVVEAPSMQKGVISNYIYNDNLHNSNKIIDDETGNQHSDLR